MSIRRSFAALVVVAALTPASAWAQSPPDPANIATARDLTKAGYGALEKKDWAAAAAHFKNADSLYHAPTITLGLARAYVGLGKLVSAQEAYSRVTHETVPPNASEAFMKAIADAQHELDALKPRVPGVVINLKGGTNPKVTIDGADVPAAALGVKRAVDPGQHVVKVTAPGFFPAEGKFTVAEGKVETVSIELKVDPNYKAPPPDTKTGIAPPPAEPEKPVSKTQKTIGFVGLGVGGAALIMGAVTGGLALSKRSALLEACPDGHCAKGSEGQHQSDVDGYNTMGTLSTIGFVSGGVLAVAGVVLIVTAPKAQKAQTGWVKPVVGLGYLGAEGKF